MAAVHPGGRGRITHKLLRGEYRHERDACQAAGAWRTILIRRRTLEPIDDESVPLRFRRLEPQPELFLDRGEHRGSGVRPRID
jgi:hypothetical protein